MKIISLSSGLLHWYQSITRYISVFSGQMKVIAINQLMQRPQNSFLLSEWFNMIKSALIQVPYSALMILLEFVHFKCESKIKIQGCKLKTKAKFEPGLITVENQVVFLLSLLNQFTLIHYIELN